MSKSMKACSDENLNTTGVILPELEYGYLEMVQRSLNKIIMW